MEILKLPEGERAPDEVDCISIERQDDGRYELQGSALINCGDGDEVESVSLVQMTTYDTYEEAEAVGLAWAAEQCVEQLYVSTVGFGTSSPE
ncbi:MULTISPECIES: hypothetical protein [unclassified Sphingomonas]|uniref:hypothetical protein n=1 Tax=unclassified Sphingomonas TaxID=196159 RepID=UPI002269A630|nr:MULTISPECIES: hypothetical protein [unclassified Sphingomonas]